MSTIKRQDLHSIILHYIINEDDVTKEDRSSYMIQHSS